MTDLAEDIHTHFIVSEFTWKIGGEDQQPTVEDIDKVLSHAKTVLDELGDEEVQLEIGRLLFKKRDSTIDVFVMFAEL